MGKVSAPGRVKIVTGMIFSDIGVFDKTVSSLSERLGPIDHQSETLGFNYTDYYKEEMGAGLKRRFISFKKLRALDHIWELKNASNRIEEKFSDSGHRRINIDPGYLTLSKLVLLTTKNYAHRIHLEDGIYSEITLFYKNGTFKPWEWTYPDYATREYISFFNGVRKSYSDQTDIVEL